MSARPPIEGPATRRGIRAGLSSPPVLSALGLTLLAVVVRLPYVGMGVVAPDTLDYLARAESVVAGNGFPDAFRTPIIPLLFAGFEALGTEPVVALVLLQNLIGILMPAAVLLLGWRYFNPATGIIAGFLAAASPLLILTEQFALTDYLYGIAIFGGAVLLVEAALRVRAQRPSYRWLIAAGAVFGFAALTRGNGQYAVVAMPLALLLCIGDPRKTLKPAALAIAGMLVVLAPWVLHNMINYGTPQVTTLGGLAMYVRVVDHDRKPPPVDSEYGPLARSTYDSEYAYAPEDQQLTSGLTFSTALANHGHDSVEISSIMAGIAIEVIRDDPSSYLANTWEIFREYQTSYDPSSKSGEDHIVLATAGLLSPSSEASLRGRAGAIPGASRITREPWEVAQLLSRIVYLLSLAGISMLALPFLGSPKARACATVLLTVLLLGAVSGAASAHFEPRYDISYAFLAWLLMAAGAVALVQIAARFARSLASRCASTKVVRDLRFPDGDHG